MYRVPQDSCSLAEREGVWGRSPLGSRGVCGPQAPSNDQFIKRWVRVYVPALLLNGLVAKLILRLGYSSSCVGPISGLRPLHFNSLARFHVAALPTVRYFASQTRSQVTALCCPLVCIDPTAASEDVIAF